MKLSQNKIKLIPVHVLQFAKRLVDKYPLTFFTGGTVRDILQNKKPLDYDIATSATPRQVIDFCNTTNILHDASAQNFGIIKIKLLKCRVEIATFRKEQYGNNRYPKIKFIRNVKTDSNRRDFTINSFYLSPKSFILKDFHNGYKDLKHKKIKFIGSAQKKIMEDPLRLIRAFKYAYILKFQIDNKDLNVLNKIKVIKKIINKKRYEKEIRDARISKKQKHFLKKLFAKIILTQVK